MPSLPAPLLLSAVLLAALSCAACAAPAEDAPSRIVASGAYSKAIAAAEESPEQATVQLRAALAADGSLVQRALLEPAFRELRDTREFRILIHQASVSHAISSLTLAPGGEKGEWIEIEGHVVDADGKSVAGAVVHVFATDANGRYHPTLEGEGTARIFGTLVSDEGGRVRFRTVRPGSYPGTRNPRHVHVQVRAGTRRLDAPGYLVFDDDPLLYEKGNEEPRGEAIRIRVTKQSDAVRGMVVLPLGAAR